MTHFSLRIRGTILLIAGLLMLIIGTPLMYVSGQNDQAFLKKLETEGKTIQGTVNSLHERVRKSDRMSFSYQVNGRSYERNEDVSREFLESLREGGPVTVRYVPSQPEDGVADFEKFKTGAKNKTGVGLIFFALISLGMVGGGYFIRGRG